VPGVPKLLTHVVPPPLPWQARRAGDDYGVSDTPDWRDVNWQPHLHQAQIHGRSVNYVDYGEADAGIEPVVFIHGLGGCWQNWLENIPRVAASGRRVIGIDLPGFGFSEMPADGISISGYGRTLDALCEQLDLGEAIFVGNSMGGYVGAEVAIQHPSRVARLVLVSAVGISTSDLAHKPIVTGGRLVGALGARTAAMSRKLVVRKRLRGPLYATFIRHPSRIASDLLYEITAGAGRKGFVDALGALIEYDVRDRISDIGVPTLIVWGREDALVPVSDASEYERLIPNARKVIFERTGHVAMIERPRTFNDCLIEFLDAEPRGAKSEGDLENAAAGG
jgi:pimeloyl-ACP methyl ester carboxylesterase